MSLWRQLTHGLRNLLHPSRRRQDIADEIGQYFDEAAAELELRGLTPEQARRAARRHIGNPLTERDRAHAYGWENAVESLLRDVRFAARQLAKHPLFTSTAVLTLALGIGANTAIFTVVQSVLLAPLPYAHADQIMALNTRWTDSGKVSTRVTGPDAADVRDQARSFAAVGLYSSGTIGVQLKNHSVYTAFALADAQFPAVFSLQPVAGRLFTAAEAHHAALVGERFARAHFGSAQGALGQVLHIEGEALEITGVLPAAFTFPGQTEVWEAAPSQPEARSRTAFNYKAVARLRDGVSSDQAQSELSQISARLQAAYPAENRNKQLHIDPLQKALTGSARPTLLLLWATVAIILLIACANVTHLQLVRSMERQRELAIRKALGSSRWQVMRPVLVEGLLLSVLGGAAGVLIAFPAVRILVRMAPQELPRAAEIHLNGWVLAFTLSLSIVTALASSLIPALRAARVNAAETLKQDAARGLTRQGATKLRNSLVIAEIAATFLLSVGAVLLLRTMTTLMARDMGFAGQSLLVVDANIPAHSTEEAQRGVQQFNEIFARLSALPGVEHVAGIMGLPTGNYGSNGFYEVRDGLAAPADHKPYSLFSVASPDYFQTMNIPLRAGRDFNAQDTASSPFVAIISQSLARQSFGNADPVGKQIRCGLDSDQWMTVIGVVGDTRQDSPAEKPGPNLYMPMAQHPFYANQIHIVLRSAVRPLTLLNAVQAQIVAVNPLVAMRFTTMDDLLQKSMAAERFRAVLLSCFAGLGLLLATLGVYSAMAYSVTQRTFEIGIRMAFGADRTEVLADVLKRAATLAVCGIAFGLLCSLMLTRVAASLLANLLEGVRPTDPLSLAIAVVLLLATALAAGFVPARRATRVSPITALRAE